MKTQDLTIVHTHKGIQQPERQANAFAACLAVDKGIASEVEHTGTGWLVIAEDGRAVAFDR